MSRLFCVSNRVSLPDPVTGQIKAGGLAVGVCAALEEQGGGVWFGWNGSIVGSDMERGPRPVQSTERRGIEFLTMPFTEQEYSGFYKGMSNEGLWPLMHELGEHIAEDGQSYQGYRDVNKLFARMMVPHLQPDDVIWVHDYHLMPLATELRAMGVKNPILYFHHIPIPRMGFVNSDAVPDALRGQYEELTQSLFAYDMVGFQSYRDYNNFMNYVGNVGALPPRFTPVNVQYGPYQSQFGVFPISIETAQLQRLAREAALDPAVKAWRERLGDGKVIIGAERLDYTKGLPGRMEAINSLLERFPEHTGAMKYVQINPLSRDDIRQYKQEIADTRSAVDRLQVRFGSPHWTPVEYVEQNIPREQLIGYFRQADVGLVTPLMDGQNLVAKEFLAAQDPDDPGMLVLSRYAGAAEQLGNAGAIIVDPRNPAEIAGAINFALTLSRKERVAAHQRAITCLNDYDIAHWARQFLTEAQDLREGRHIPRMQTPVFAGQRMLLPA
jgi:trehalose 6-phosphate synthase